jgi:hypothetical protein
MFNLFLPQTPLRALRIDENLFVFSHRGAGNAENFNIYFVLASKAFASSAPLREKRF